MKTIIFSRFSAKHRERESKQIILNLIRQNKLVFTLTVFLFFGILFGAISARYSDEQMLENMDFLFASNFKARLSLPLFNIFVASLSSSFVFLLCLFMMGSSIWGLAFIPTIPFFRGFGVGLTAGYLYSTYGFTGVAFHFLVLLPSVLISSVAIIIEAKESTIFSARLAAKIRPNSDFEKIWPNMKNYLTKTGYMLIALVVSALLDVFCTMTFAQHFSF